MKRQKRTAGSILKIKLSDDSHSYAIILEKASIAVFDVKTQREIPIDEIIKLDTLFDVAVYNTAITSGRWEKIGSTQLEERFKILPLKFIQDSINPKLFQIYNPNTGTMTDATKEECEGLECAAVWEAGHVEDRILDHFNGKENIWLKSLSIK